MINPFRLSINNLFNLMNWVISQLQNRAVEKISSAANREEAAEVLLAEAAQERTEACVAVNLADNLAKLMK